VPGDHIGLFEDRNAKGLANIITAWVVRGGSTPHRPELAKLGVN
jgi:hypothetical protein